MNRFLLLPGLVLLSLMAGCAGQTDQSSKTNIPVMSQPISCIAVLPAAPVYMTEGRPTAAQVETMSAGVQALDKILASQLQGKMKVTFIQAGTVHAGSKDFSQLRQIENETGCNVVLSTELLRYRQRAGGEAAVENPASAAFSLHLVQTEDNRAIWNADFDETQESLLGNLLSFNKAEKRGFKWITVEELISQGMQEQLQSCPYLQ